MSKVFKLSFRMATKESGAPVCFKQDGQRFEQPFTVKLNGDTDYEMRFILKPVVHIDKLMINGDMHKLTTQQASASEFDTLTYVSDFTTTGYDLSKSGKRKELLIVLELENGVYMKISLQCKLYKVGDTSHAQWGQKLNTLDMECEICQQQNYVRILKEKYL